MANGEFSNSFEGSTMRLVGVIKNAAELLVMIGLFSFIGKAYFSTEATIVSYALLIALGAHVSAGIQYYMMKIPKSGHKHFGKILLLSGIAGVAITSAINLTIVAPTLRAIERQLAATPPALQLQAVPSPAGNQGQTSAGTAAPKLAAAPSAAAAAAPAPIAPPSAAQSRSSTPAERKPD
jgi:multidrug transporter EmrE-like cation transporter